MACTTSCTVAPPRTVGSIRLRAALTAWWQGILARLFRPPMLHGDKLDARSRRDLGLDHPTARQRPDPRETAHDLMNRHLY